MTVVDKKMTVVDFYCDTIKNLFGFKHLLQGQVTLASSV